MREWIEKFPDGRMNSLQTRMDRVKAYTADASGTLRSLRDDFRIIRALFVNKSNANMSHSVDFQPSNTKNEASEGVHALRTLIEAASESRSPARRLPAESEEAHPTGPKAALHWDLELDLI